MSQNNRVDRTRRAVLGTVAGMTGVGVAGLSAASGGSGPPASEPVWFSGHAHEPLGDASLEATGSELVVSNTEHADDGVGVQLDQVSNFRATMADTLLTGPGQSVTLAGRGTVDGESNAPIGQLALEDTGDGVGVDPNFDPVGASAMRVAVYVDGFRVGYLDITHRSDLILRYRDYTTGWYYDYGIHNGSNSGPGVGIGFDDVATLDVGDDISIDGDTFVFYAEETDATVTDLSSTQIRTNVGSFAITDETSN